jgi:hypothetical protein
VRDEANKTQAANRWLGIVAVSRSTGKQIGLVSIGAIVIGSLALFWSFIKEHVNFK